MPRSEPSVLVVDDEPNVAEAYSLWLDAEYDVDTAYDGSEAVEQVTDETDVVLLDRRMPELSGDEALEAIREAGYDCRVAMVTAVDPDFDIVEMPFDSYLTKPITREEAVEAIEELLAIDEYEETIQEQFAAAKKRAALESRKPAGELEESDAFSDLEATEAELSEGNDLELDHDAVAKTLSGMDDDTTETAF